MISANNHDITRLLLLMIIDSGKKCTISIIDKQNIAINKQNQLIAKSLYYVLLCVLNSEINPHIILSGCMYIKYQLSII